MTAIATDGIPPNLRIFVKFESHWTKIDILRDIQVIVFTLH